jgi:hypothetical protein
VVAATLTPTEDQTFDALFGWIALALDLPDDTAQIVKGFQNLVSAPIGSYIVVSPGIMQHQDTGRREYDADAGLYVEERHVTYSYQVDCYGELGPTWASILSVAWRSLWGVEAMTTDALTPLYADAPEQVNIVNSEKQFEQRYKIRLFGQVNQRVSLAQDFFDEALINTITVANQL